MNTYSSVLGSLERTTIAVVGHGTSGRETPPARLTIASATAVAATLQALTAPSRLMILSQLRQAPATVGELTEAVRMEQSAVSHQLRLLRAMGLVSAQRNGRSITYSLYDNHVASLLDEAVYHAEHVRLGDTDSGGTRLMEDEADAAASLRRIVTATDRGLG